MPKAQKHCKLHDFYAWTVPKNYEKLAKNRPKNAQQGPPKRIFKFYPLFFPPRTPKNVKNPSRLKDFRGGSAAGARPRVAKAMLSCHHYTGEASPDLRAAAPARRPRKNDQWMKPNWHQHSSVRRTFRFSPFSYVYLYEIYLTKYFDIVRKPTHQTPSPPWAVPRWLQPECGSWARESISFY